MTRPFLVLHGVGWEGTQEGFLVSCLYHHIPGFLKAVPTGDEERVPRWRAIRGAGCGIGVSQTPSPHDLPPQDSEFAPRFGEVARFKGTWEGSCPEFRASAAGHPLRLRECQC